jgi:cytochrome d ubiquinol oxidase subunit II
MPDLATAWFLLVGVLLAGYAILDGFDLGVGVLHLFLARDERERRILINAVGPVWDGNEVWLLTAGGALFAAFPAVYATVFSGFYLAMMLLLVGLVLRAVSLEFRGKVESARWRRTWDVAFAVGSFLPALLLGVALGNVMRGLPLTVEGEFAGTFLGLLNPFALLTGLAGLAFFVLQGATWLMLKTEGELRTRARGAALGGWIGLLVGWLLVTAVAGWAAPHLWVAFRHPLAWLAPAAVMAALVRYPRELAMGRPGHAFALSSGAIAGLLGIVGLGLYPNLVPTLGPGPALTVHNAASSPLTLRVMLVIALAGMPLVIGYTAFIYRSFRGPVRLDDVSY